MILSLFLGLLFTCSFFAISFFLVIGVKSVIIFIKSRLTPTPEPIFVKPKKRRKKRTPVRSIEIDPEETTRIVVKKTG